jgi:hypothetical protein
MEGPRISIAHLAPLLDWNLADEERKLADYYAMHRVLYASHREVQPVDLAHAIRQILQLVAGFCRRYDLGPIESHDLNAAVRSRLAWRLMEMAGRCSDQEYAEIRELIVNRKRLHWLNLFTSRAARDAFVFLRGPRMLAAVEPWRSR